MSPQPESARVIVGQPGEWSPEERRILLELAHRSIEAGLSGQPIDATPPTEHLAVRRGAFTTLHLHGGLRGCVGYVIAAYPLYRTIVETAQAAAFSDTRFMPVEPNEAPLLKIEISVLTEPRPIRPEEVEIGKHGLIVTMGPRRGLLLPQVPVEHGWDRLTFLEQTCYKAGLSFDAWQRGAMIEGFSAEVFGEE
jgi:AmmeMemoRadiSam system protein A